MGDLIVIGDEEDTRMVNEVRVEDDEEKRELESVLLRETGPFKWEKFLPVTGIRVLVVEADESTRHIIAALLRKCNYKVVAVADGLEAWKVLKRRHSNIDLILTEADLPSISGYALLSLIMEHQCCKHIPVVMMSSGDSINMVLKCMSLGAADFLTKPLRKNELKNLWQHVWRRLNVNGRNEPRDENNGQCKADATSGKEAANNPCSESSDNASANKKRQPNEKAGEVQSFYIRHCLEAENMRKESVQGISAKRQNKEPTNLSHKKKKQQHEENVKPEEVESCIERMAMVDGVAPEEGCKNMATGEELQKPSRVAIDLIGRIDGQQSCIFKEYSSDHETINKFSFDPQLELSLRGYQDQENQGMEEMVKLKHSNASAFSRYGNKQMGSGFPSSSSICTETNGGEYEISTDLAPSENTPSSSGGFRGESTTVVSQSPETGGPAAFPNSHQQLTPLAFNGIYAGYGTIFPPNYGSQVLPVAIHPSLALQKESSPFSASSSLHSSDPGTLSSTPGRCQYEQEATNLFSDPHPVHEHKALASMEQHQSNNGQSTSGSVSTRIIHHHPSSNGGYKTVSDGTMGSATPGANVVQNEGVEERKKADAVDNNHMLKHDQIKGVDPNRNALREAALAKFKQKRKDRCFDKKVRYQSRKKLAEQRPRVKGQFVRQA